MQGLFGAVLGAIAAAILGLGTALYLEHRALNTAELRYEQLVKVGAELNAENARWKIDADIQNKKLQELAARQAVLKMNAAKALAAARKNGARGIAAAEKIMALKTPADDCAGARAVEQFFFGQAR